ncbi:MAG: hypothetical protein TREMPRED_005801 [Tremellales sp. Tagirdzhanova-0007]|nr:MAG: hypothetical protein TREMPRED_005801 [Tremellales sp. Tagirdzhanova-0007]
MSALDLPTLDLSETDLNVLGQQFRTAGETTGFMQIVNHGVPPELMSRAFDQAEKFFKLPLEEKVRLARDPETSRGYLMIGSQALEGSLGKGHEGAHILEKAQEAMKSGDQKEGFTITRDTPRDHKNYHRRAHGENQMPREEQVPGLRTLGEDYTNAMFDLQGRMMRIVAASLGADPDKGFGTDVLRDAIIYWRFLHYPPTKEVKVTGAGAHTDFGFTTLLATHGVPGLEVYYAGAWHIVKPEEGSFIVNIGDCLSRLSGGQYKSSLHRVMNTSGLARYSIPCFLEGNPDFVVRPLNAPEDSSERFPTVEDLLIERQRTTFPQQPAILAL